MKRILVATFAFLLGFTATAIAQTEVPHEFQPGQPARAAEVNDNFDVLVGAIDTNAAVITDNEAAIQANAEAILRASSGDIVVLDFKDSASCVIDQPGRYAINRSWDWHEENLCHAPSAEFDHPVIRVTADDVSIDLNGFELGSYWIDTTFIEATGARFEIRNGRLVTESYYAGGLDLNVIGPEFLIDNITAGTINAVGDNGLINSVRTNDGGINLGEHGTLQNSSIRCGAVDCVWVNSSSVVRSNLIHADAGSAIALYPFAEEVVQHVLIVDNIIVGTDPESISVSGNNNVIRSNIMETRYVDGGIALIVSGSGNIIESNLILPGHRTGILFQKDGNYYGSNRVAATTPFDLGGTLQTDWGGNVSF